MTIVKIEEECGRRIVARIEEGIKGDQGMDAYEVALLEGFVGSREEWLESLIGPPVPVAQELGDDPNLAVSQKLLKDSIDKMESSNIGTVADAKKWAEASSDSASKAKSSETSAANSAASALKSANESKASASAAKASESASKASETQAENMALMAKSFQDNANASATAAKRSETAADVSAKASEASKVEAGKSQAAAKASETASAKSAASAKASETAAKTSEENAANSAESVLTLDLETQQNAEKASNAASAASSSEAKALASEKAAALSQISAATSSDNAKNSESASKASETAARSSELAAKEASESAEASSESANTYAVESKASAEASSDSASDSKSYAEQSEQYAANAKEYEISAKEFSEQADSAADRAEEAAKVSDEKLDKDAVKDELGDSTEFVVSQRKVSEIFKNNAHLLEILMSWVETPSTYLFADFTKNRFSKIGVVSDFGSLFGFERLSEATTFDSDGLEIWGVDEPRIVRGKGLLVEPEQTQLFTVRDWTPTSRATTSSLATTIPEGSVITGVDGGAGREEWRVSKGIVQNNKKQSAGFIIDLGNSNVRYISVGTYPFGFPNGHSFVNSYDLYEKKWAKYVPHIPKIEVDNVGSVYFVRFTTASLTTAYDNVTVWMGNDGDDPTDNSKWTTLGAGQQVKLMYPQRTISDTTLLSLIPSQDTPATRLPDTLSLPIPRGHTIKGDWDSSLTLKVVDGKLVHEGIGYIRKLEVVVADSFEIDFLENTTKSDTGVIHEGLYSFERLSEATTFSEDGLKVWGVDEPRVVSGKGLLIEPQRTNEVMQDFLPETPTTVRGITTTVIPSPMGGDSLLLNVDYQYDEGNQSYSASIYKNWTSTTNLPTETVFTASLYVLPVQVNSRYPVIPPDGAPVMDRAVFLQLISGDSHNLVTLKGETGGAWGRVEYRGPRRGGNCHIFLGNRTSNANFDPAPSGDEKVGVWGLQFEVQEGATSYIPTHGTPATRLADLITLPSGYTVSGDYDDGINVKGTQVTGFGYIRKLILEKK